MKKLLIGLTIILIFCIANLIMINNSAPITFNKVVLEQDMPIPTDIRLYVDTHLKNCSLDINSIDNKLGKDKYNVICNDKKYTGTLEIVDTISPVVMYHDYYINKGQTIDFLESIYYSNGKIATIEEGVDQELNEKLKEIGKYEHTIKIKDDSNNEVDYNAYINVLDKKIGKRLLISTSGNFSNNMTNQEYLFVMDEQDKLIGNISVINTYVFNDCSEYEKEKENLEPNKYNGISGQIITDDNNNKILHKYVLTDNMINDLLDSKDLTYSNIKEIFTNLGYKITEK